MEDHHGNRGILLITGARMDPRLVEFVQSVARDIAGLEVALYFQDNPTTFDTAEGLALRIRRSPEEVSAALERLTAAGVLESALRDEGHYVCYSLSSDPKIWNLLCLLSEAYVDNTDDRKEIIRTMINRRGPSPLQQKE